VPHAPSHRRALSQRDTLGRPSYRNSSATAASSSWRCTRWQSSATCRPRTWNSDGKEAPTPTCRLPPKKPPESLARVLPVRRNLSRLYAHAAFKRRVAQEGFGLWAMGYGLLPNSQQLLAPSSKLLAPSLSMSGADDGLPSAPPAESELTARVPSGTLALLAGSGSCHVQVEKGGSSLLRAELKRLWPTLFSCTFRFRSRLRR
jgi:hypothetical protein